MAKSMTQATITEVIVAGNHSADEIADMFHLTEQDVKDIQASNDRKLNDENVSEEEYQEWCDAIDADHGTATI